MRLSAVADIVLMIGVVVGLCLLLIAAWPTLMSARDNARRMYGPRSVVAGAALLLSPPLPLFGLLLAKCFLRVRRPDQRLEGFVDWWTEGTGMQRHEPLSRAEIAFAVNIVLLLACGAVLFVQDIGRWQVVSHAFIVGMITVPWIVAGALSRRLIWQAIGRYINGNGFRHA